MANGTGLMTNGESVPLPGGSAMCGRLSPAKRSVLPQAGRARGASTEAVRPAGPGPA